MVEVKQTSIRLPKEMLIQIKALAVEKETTQNNIITEFIAKGLKTAEKDKSKIKQMPFVDPDKKGNMGNNAGIIEVEKS